MHAKSIIMRMVDENMKRYKILLLCVLAVFLFGGCFNPPSPSTTPILPTATPQITAERFTTVVPAVTPSTTAILPTLTLSLTSTPATTKPPKADSNVKAVVPAAQSAKEMAMQRDINLLISRSDDQQGQESNYKNLKKAQYLTVERVSAKELKFVGKPQIFKGDYTNRFTAKKSYKYFADASMGGKRYYNVKDNFGVWIVFQYQDPNFKAK